MSFIGQNTTSHSGFAKMHLPAWVHHGMEELLDGIDDFGDPQRFYDEGRDSWRQKVKIADSSNACKIISACRNGIHYLNSCRCLSKLSELPEVCVALTACMKPLNFDQQLELFNVMYRIIVAAHAEASAPLYNPKFEAAQVELLCDLLCEARQTVVCRDGDRNAITVCQGEFAISKTRPLGSVEVNNCLAIAVKNLVTEEIGLAHLDNRGTDTVLDAMLTRLRAGQDACVSRLVGARLDESVCKETSQASAANVMRTRQALQRRNVSELSADLWIKPQPSSLVVYPDSFQLEDIMPAAFAENVWLRKLKNTFVRQPFLTCAYDEGKGVVTEPVLELTPKMQFTFLQVYGDFISPSLWKGDAKLNDICITGILGVREIQRQIKSAIGLRNALVSTKITIARKRGSTETLAEALAMFNGSTLWIGEGSAEKNAANIPSYPSPIVPRSGFIKLDLPKLKAKVRKQQDALSRS